MTQTIYRGMLLEVPGTPALAIGMSRGQHERVADLLIDHLAGNAGRHWTGDFAEAQGFTGELRVRASGDCEVPLVLEGTLAEGGVETDPHVLYFDYQTRAAETEVPLQRGSKVALSAVWLPEPEQTGETVEGIRGWKRVPVTGQVTAQRKIVFTAGCKTAMPTSWRAYDDSNVANDYECVILPQSSSRRRYYEVLTYGTHFGNYERLADAKAGIEEIYGPVNWTRVRLPLVEVEHYFYGPTTEFTDPLLVYAADLPRLGGVHEGLLSVQGGEARGPVLPASDRSEDRQGANVERLSAMHQHEDGSVPKGESSDPREASSLLPEEVPSERRGGPGRVRQDGGGRRRALRNLPGEATDPEHRPQPSDRGVPGAAVRPVQQRAGSLQGRSGTPGERGGVLAQPVANLGTRLWWRVHPEHREFMPETATSIPFFPGPGERPQPGFSALDDPWHLWLYIWLMWGWEGQPDQVIGFTGQRVGEGNDGEALVMPDGGTVLRYTKREFFAELMDTPFPESPVFAPWVRGSIDGHARTWEALGKRMAWLDRGEPVEEHIARIFAPQQVAAKVAMPVGPPPPGLRYLMTWNNIGRVPATRAYCMLGAVLNGEVVGYLTWGLQGRKVQSLWVKPEHRRRRIAETMFNLAKTQDSGIIHHPDRTDSGEAWVQFISPEEAERINNTTEGESDRPNLTLAGRLLEPRHPEEVIDLTPMAVAASKTGAIPLHEWISLAEMRLEEEGFTGQRWHIPRMHVDDPAWDEAHRPVQEFVREVLASEGVTDLRIRVYMTTYGMAGVQAATDGMNYIQVGKEDVTTLTLLHECAHIVNRSAEGEGHDMAFIEVAARLYSRYISPEAGEWFAEMATPPTRTASAEVQIEVEGPDWIGDYTVIARSGDEVVGRLKGGKYNSVEKVYVAPEYRRKGIATRMYRALQEASGGLTREPDEFSDSGAAWFSTVGEDPRGYFSTWGTEPDWSRWMRAASKCIAASTMTWGQVKAKYLVYAAYSMDHAVNEYAHIHDGEVVTADLVYTEEQVDLRDVRFQRYPSSDERMGSLLEAYKRGDPVPPVLLVKRAGELLTVDGHHRLSAQEAQGRTLVPAVIAHSLREERYSGVAASGYTSRTAKTATYDGTLIARGLNLDVQKPLARKIVDGTVTAQDFVNALMSRGGLGIWWGVMGSFGDIEDFEAYAWGSGDESLTVRSEWEDYQERVAVGDGTWFGSECRLVLVAKRPTREGQPWDPEFHNPLEAGGLMGNSYLADGEQVELVEVRYDAGWGWKSLPAQGIRATARADGGLRATAVQPGVYYHVTSYSNWPDIRANGLRPGADGHVWLFTETEPAMRFKDAWDSSGWTTGVPPEQWKVPPCIVVVRTDRAVPTSAGIPGAYWVEGSLTKDEVYDVIRPEDLHHYAAREAAGA